jgi:hypothetical protein
MVTLAVTLSIPGLVPAFGRSEGRIIRCMPAGLLRNLGRQWLEGGKVRRSHRPCRPRLPSRKGHEWTVLYGRVSGTTRRWNQTKTL